MLKYFAFAKFMLNFDKSKANQGMQVLTEEARLKNGLSPIQVEKAKDLFKKVTLKFICQKAGMPVSAIYNILRDRDNRIELLAKVIIEAQSEIKRREQVASELPL